MFGLLIALAISSFFYWYSWKNGIPSIKWVVLSFLAYTCPFVLIHGIAFPMIMDFYKIPKQDQATFIVLSGFLSLAIILFLLGKIMKTIKKYSATHK